jgi:hypothetical protein
MKYTDFATSIEVYNPLLPDDQQCGGYYLLKEMILSKSPPDDLRMRLIHPKLRAYLVEYWDEILRLNLTK